MGNNETGKLEFAKALDLLSSAQRRFITTLSRLRNPLAHDPAFLAFSFEGHLATMDKNQKATFLDGIVAMTPDDKRSAERAKAEAKPKLAMVAGVANLLLFINGKTLLTSEEHKLRVVNLSKEYLELLEQQAREPLPTGPRRRLFPQ